MSKGFNLSTRGPVRTGGALMIAGFYLGGTQIHRVLIRGVGPGMVPYGLDAGAILADPRITVFSGQTPIFFNDDWGSAATAPEVVAAAAATGAFALADRSKDAALVVTLPPGLFTVLVSDKNGASGVAIVEVYEMAP